MSYQPIENYGIIGDLHTVALVGMDGSIDFMCFPHFDSPTIFGALLDREKGGRFQIAPTLEQSRPKQLYLPDSNMLLTRFLSEDGVAEISDFMPAGPGVKHHHDLVRRVKAVRGDVEFFIHCQPAFNYGRSEHEIDVREGEVLFISKGPDHTRLRLRTEVPVQIVDGAVYGKFRLKSGQTAAFILEEAKPGMESPSLNADYVSESFKATLTFWNNWVRKSTYKGRWREMVTRSALVLKLLTSARHGSMVAAPTFGLPEELGGERNWDYRYTWIRDASFTLYALMRLGYTEEATSFMRWVEDRCQELTPDGQLQIMYGLDGSHELPEIILPHWEGYAGSSPVRIGNGAFDQLQLDIYGELMDSVYLYNKYGEPISYDLWRNLSRMMNWVAENWNQPDEGIWEVRGGRRHFLYSRLMCWVALDRAIRLADKRSFPAPRDHWRTTRDAIFKDIYQNFWSPKLKAFVQYQGAETLDASCLLMPLVRFTSSTDPRWLSTLKSVEEHLVEDSLVFRYNHTNAASDGLKGKEGTFTMCSFWYVECLTNSGDLDQARFLFNKALGYANHLGLYAEELGPQGEHLGNFPQAFTHLGLISAAFNLNRRLDERH